MAAPFLTWHADRLVSKRPLRWTRLGSVSAPNHPYAVRLCIEAGLFAWHDLPNVRVAHAEDPRLVSEARAAGSGGGAR